MNNHPALTEGRGRLSPGGKRHRPGCGKRFASMGPAVCLATVTTGARAGAAEVSAAPGQGRGAAVATDASWMTSQVV